MPLKRTVTWRFCFRWMVGLVGGWIGLDLLSRLGAEILWFQEVGYLPAFLLRLVIQVLLGIGASAIAAAYLLRNLALAQRLKHSSLRSDAVSRQGSIASGNLRPPPRSLLPISLNLVRLLPLVLGLSLLVGLILFHYGQVAVQYWHCDRPLPESLASNLFRPVALWQLDRWALAHLWSVGLLVGLTIALLVAPQFWLTAIALILSAVLGLVLSQQWTKVLQYLHPASFNGTDPVFDRNISFYIFTLPVWELLEFWLMAFCLYGLVAVTLIYLLSGDSLSQGSFPGFTAEQQRHLYGLGSGTLLVVALSYWLSRYKLLYSARGVAYGASYTDIRAQLPAYTGLSLLALAIAAYLLWQIWRQKSAHLRSTLWGIGLYLLLAATADSVLPIAVQSLVVQPNELVRERPYIERSIALTRQAFDLEAIEVKTFDPQGQLTEADLQKNNLTIRNIRLWDERPLLETNRQLQQIRLYYRFADADIDRYALKDEGDRSKNTESRQVLIAGRELDYTAVPQQAKTWVNQHLIYTHGYGFTVSPVNVVGAGGLPEYFVKDIGVSENSPLTTSSQSIRDSIPIGQPRIYYGEITNTYVMTATKAKELDYPSGNDNVYNTYKGRGGIPIGWRWRKWMFAKYLNDWQMLLTRDFTPETRLLFRRNINQRMQAIAPFLRYDSDPYLVTAKTADANSDYLYWIVDAYTTSDRYPYSDPGSEGINYIRNSVKVVIDAYHGSVNFYIADTNDPIIASWSAIFPKLFKPLRAMPTGLRQHLRYPTDFFKIQSERLMTYHMTDPQVFYNREDQWQIPNEVYGDKPKLVEPYYLITSLPGVPFEEFVLLLPFTPRQRTNLIAWLAARSDGENYGKLLLYVLPKQRLVYGIEQIEARINQDPVISQQISLWNRQGSKALQGNLLVIPIEQSLLYVEPIYLEADQNSLPTLVRVVVAYENRIVMAQTLRQALAAIFQSKEIPTPAIVRPVEEPAQSQ